MIYFCITQFNTKPKKTKQIMKQIRILALAIAVILFAASCSKDKEDKPVNNASIQGRWSVNNIVTVEPNNETGTYTGKEGDFVEFKSDGTMSSSVDGYEQTVEYEIVDATHVNVDGSVSEIKELTSHKLVVLDPAHEGQSENITYTLTK
jgi:hypothetical protein